MVLMDISELNEADNKTLVKAATECSRQQCEILSAPDELGDDLLVKLEQLENVRSELIHRINWKQFSLDTDSALLLSELERLDQANQLSLKARHNNQLEVMNLVKKRRNVAEQYSSLNK